MFSKITNLFFDPLHISLFEIDNDINVKYLSFLSCSGYKLKTPVLLSQDGKWPPGQALAEG